MSNVENFVFIFLIFLLNINFINCKVTNNEYYLATIRGNSSQVLTAIELGRSSPLNKTIDENGMVTINMVLTKQRLDLLNEFNITKISNIERKERRNLKSKPKYVMTYDLICNFLDKCLNHSTPNRTITVTIIGKSYLRKPIKMICLKNKCTKTKNHLVFLDAGIHAREWISIQTALYIIQEFVYRPELYPSSYSIDWCIIPSINPDGYDYTVNNYRWHRKNMNPRNCDPMKCDCGVDLNRNFPYMFGVSGVSSDPCDEVHHGPYPFSEPESIALANILNQYANEIKLYISLHSYGNLFLYPWGYKAERCSDWKDLEAAAQYAIDMMSAKVKSVTNFKVASSGKDLYPAAGGSDDYAKAVLNIKFSYTIELQAGNYSNRFDFTPDEREKFIEENVVGILAISTYVNRYYIGLNITNDENEYNSKCDVLSKAKSVIMKSNTKIDENESDKLTSTTTHKKLKSKNKSITIKSEIMKIYLFIFYLIY